MDDAHKARKAELEEQIKNGSKDPNVKSELEAINELEANDNGDNAGANVSGDGVDATASKSKSQEKRENATRGNNR